MFAFNDLPGNIFEKNPGEKNPVLSWISGEGKVLGTIINVGRISIWPCGQVFGPWVPLRIVQSTCASTGAGRASIASREKVAKAMEGGDSLLNPPKWFDASILKWSYGTNSRKISN